MNAMSRRIWISMVGSVALMHCGGGGTGGGPGSSAQELAGVVTTRDGTPIEGVFVSAYGAGATTDGGGMFRIHGVALPPDRVVATLQKDGYFGLTVGTKPAAVGTTNIRAVLLPRELVGEIDNAVGGNVANADLSLETQANAFVDASGAPAPRARVFAAYFNPDSPSFGAEMPGGDFTADDVQGQPGVLTSFGAAIVEAETETGEPLSLASEARTCLNIPPGLRDTAPATIAVWKLGEAGRWQEIGTADRIDDKYCFNSPTLGPVNCDLFSRSAVVSGRVCDADGSPVAATRVRIGQLATTTASDGSYSVVIPAGKQVRFESDHGQDVLCKVDGNTSRELDLGACAAARKGDGTCSPTVSVDPGVVWTDASSGLSWQTPSKDDSRNWFFWQDAVDYCQALDLEGAGWRLPSLGELRSLIRGCATTQTGAAQCSIEEARVSSPACLCSYQPAGPAENGCYWPGALDGYDCERDFWSSSTETDQGAELAWTVEFRRAKLGLVERTGQAKVMCVR